MSWIKGYATSFGIDATWSHFLLLELSDGVEIYSQQRYCWLSVPYPNRQVRGHELVFIDEAFVIVLSATNTEYS